MIVLLRKGATAAAVEEILAHLPSDLDRSPQVSCLDGVTVIRVPGGLLSPPGAVEVLGRLPEVERVVARDLPYLLSSRELHPADTVVEVGEAAIGGGRVVIAAGPCSVEDSDSLRRSAEVARAAGATLLRGGAYKPRTSPYSFQGLGERGLEMLARAAEEFGLAIVTEVLSVEHVPLVSAYAQMLQVGSRSIQNFPLLEAVGSQEKPVLLKRGMMSTVEELLGSADYILSRGNPRVVLCERGIRTFEPMTRNTLDVVAIPLLKQLGHLPVMADPSHATGRAELVPAAALAAVAAGADGLIVEVHPDPGRALSDGAQALLPDGFLDLVTRARRVAAAVGRSL